MWLFPVSCEMNYTGNTPSKWSSQNYYENVQNLYTTSLNKSRACHIDGATSVPPFLFFSSTKLLKILKKDIWFSLCRDIEG